MTSRRRCRTVARLAVLALGLAASASVAIPAEPCGTTEEKPPTLSFDPDRVTFEPKWRVDSEPGPGVHATASAISQGLEWLAAHQLSDGSWSFDHTLADACDGKCRNPGELAEARNAATGLALLAFLGAGSTPKQGKFQDTVEAGYYYLVGKLAPSKEGWSLYEPGGTMYSHGIAALALCETHGMTGGEASSTAAQWSVDFIAFTQDPAGGGWRYHPRQRGDTSVTGWQVSALRSAQLAELRVAPAVLAKASKFLDGVQADRRARYAYMQGGAVRPSTTAIGLLMRLYLGWDKNHPAVKRGVEWIGEQGPSKTNMYYNYHATRLMLQVGGEPWRKWNGVLRPHLVTTQAREGHEKGSWYFEGDDLGAARGGRLYMTAMALMTLEVDYRHLPIYERPEDRARRRRVESRATSDDDRTPPE